MKVSEIKKQVNKIVALKMRSLGFKKDKIGLFFKELSSESKIEIGFGPTGSYGVNHYWLSPSIRVIHRRISEIYKELSGGGDLYITNPVLLEYILPKHKLFGWEFSVDGPDFESVVENMINALKKYGLPYMEKQATDMTYFIEEYQKRIIIPECYYVLPICYYIINDLNTMEVRLKNNLKLFSECLEKFNSTLMYYPDFAQQLLSYAGHSSDVK